MCLLWQLSCSYKQFSQWNQSLLHPKRNTVCSVRWQNETCLKQTMCSRVSGIILFCSRNMFLMCLASVTPCDCNFHCLWKFMILEATAWNHLMGHFWNVAPRGSDRQRHSVLLSRNVWPREGHLVLEEFWRMDGWLSSIWNPRRWTCHLFPTCQFIHHVLGKKYFLVVQWGFIVLFITGGGSSTFDSAQNPHLVLTQETICDAGNQNTVNYHSQK